MGAILADGLADDGRLRLSPADAGDGAVLLETQEGAQRAGDVVALRPRRAHPGPLHAAVLLEAPMVDLDAPGDLGVLQPRQLPHRQVAGRPVCPVLVWVNDREDQHEAARCRDLLAQPAHMRGATRYHGWPDA